MRLLLSPWLWLLGTVALVATLLVVPVPIPLGPNYWDLALYVDGAHRLSVGQIPQIDFEAPVGALGYYLAYWTILVFPTGNPLFVAQWSPLIITLPIMAWLMAEMGRGRTVERLALLLPFLVFQILPFNIQSYTTYAGVDGYGFYNRQVCILLYVMMAVLMFSNSPRFRALVVFIILSCLFFVKITGFLAAGLLAFYALISGRLTFGLTLLAAIAFVVVLGVLEITLGLTSAYIQDILGLVGANEGTLLPRFLTVFSVRFDTIFATILLLILLVGFSLFGAQEAAPATANHIARLGLWLAVALVAGIVFETQNTGSQDFIFLWPILLVLLRGCASDQTSRFMGWQRLAMIGLVAAIAIPPLVTVLHRAARAVVGSVTYQALEVPRLKSFGRVRIKQAMHERVEMINRHYANHRVAYEDLAAQGQLPNWTYYSEIPMQAAWLKQLDTAVKRLQDIEEKAGEKFDSAFVMDFTSPLAWALGALPPKHVPIGLDPQRTMTSLSEAAISELQGTTVMLQPMCPATTSRNTIADFYRPITQTRTAIKLDPCWVLYLKSSDVQKFGLQEG
ncbi:MAG: hypothetical protein ABJM29_14865 [Rhizobiaceae bacterium]